MLQQFRTQMDCPPSYRWSSRSRATEATRDHTVGQMHMSWLPASSVHGCSWPAIPSVVSWFHRNFVRRISIGISHVPNKTREKLTHSCIIQAQMQNGTSASGVLVKNPSSALINFFSLRNVRQRLINLRWYE
jgi:hypothetical protein